MSDSWSKQPWKTLFLIVFLAKSIPYIIACSVVFLVKSFRPLPDWSYKTALGTKLLRTLFGFMTITRSQKAPQLSAGKSGDRFTKVLPAPTGALWFPAPVQPNDPELSSQKVCIHVPGGAFVLGFDMEEVGKAVADLLIESYGATHVLHTTYRLASFRTPFPAALQDVLSSYQYVLGLGVPPENISIVGDSAGDNIVIALLRFLETAQSLLPCPCSVLSFSPWIDVTAVGIHEYATSRASRYDPLYEPLLWWGSQDYTPTEASQYVMPYVSPRAHPFKAKTPLFINAGAEEGFFRSIHEFSEQMRGIEGNRIMLYVSPHMPHDFFMLWPVLGTKAEAKNALEMARKFVEESRDS
ncbi:alpha/beta hydrolase fold-3 domain-containing protein [Xylariaceae sp. FL0255]|nr:alpha/beta hydrolase fold-3 domain-containing protein [Xylariaceae sp. FL0255]